MIQKIGNKIYMVFTESGFTSSNCLLVDDDIRLMIDSGADTALKEAGPSTIDILVNSHHHADHIRGNDLFDNAEILAHPLEKKAMQSPEKMTATSGWDELMEGDMAEHSRQFGGLPPRLFEPWRVDREIHDGEVIDCGTVKFHVLHTPGHTEGHCSFYFPDEGIVFLGDICLTVAGPWYGEENADIDDFIKSINRILSLKPKIVTTGHRTGVVDSDIHGVLTEYRERFLKREKRILNCICERPATIHEIAQKKLIYREHPTTFVLFWEKYMVKKHCERLIKHDAIELLPDGRYTSKAMAGVLR